VELSKARDGHAAAETPNKIMQAEEQLG